MNPGFVSNWEYVAGWLVLNDKDFAFEHACCGTEELKERYDLRALQTRACFQFRQRGWDVEGEPGPTGPVGGQGLLGSPHPLTGVHGPRGPMGPPAFMFDGTKLPIKFEGTWEKL